MWMKFRHKVVFALLRPFFWPFLRWHYGLRLEKYKLPKGPCLMIFNHTSSFDPFFMAMAFKGPIYVLATDDIFSLRFWSPIIKFLIAPIPKSKSIRDYQAVRNLITVAGEGGRLCLSPEGNRTYDGRLCNIDYAIVKMIKYLRIPLVLYEFTGGFGVNPRFSSYVRKGKIYGRVAKYLTKEEVEAIAPDDLYKLIIDTLSVDEFSTKQRFRSKHAAEQLERVVYLCPVCKTIGDLHSEGTHLRCDHCGLDVEYGEDLRFHTDNPKFPFTFLWQWYDFQVEFITRLDLSENWEIFHDDDVTLKRVVWRRKKDKLVSGRLSMDFETLSVTDGLIKKQFKLEGFTSVSVLGQNKLNIYIDKETYQLKSNQQFNALKYLQLYFYVRNARKGTKNGNLEQFLGI